MRWAGNVTYMKQRVYIETSVVSYLTARPAKNIIVAGHQMATRDFWDALGRYDVYVSELVLLEAASGDEDASKKRVDALAGFSSLDITIECKELAKKLVLDGAIPDPFPEDALHIALAAVHGIDVIATWNFKHINNPETRGKIRRVLEANGYGCPEICSPDEFLGDENE